MAKKISQLTQATQVKSDDVTVIVQDGETKKLPLNMMVTKQDIENKKVAGLAKLDEIEATYENDTYTPTITVKNKSSVKVGEGDGVDYSANVMDGPAKSAILKGSTKYRDIDTGEFLETFEEGRNLELVSVKMPVLTTSNEGGTKTNILTVNDDVELRGIGEVKDELNLITGEYVQKIYEVKMTDDVIDNLKIYSNSFIQNFDIVFNGLPDRKLTKFSTDKASITVVSDKMMCIPWGGDIPENTVCFTQNYNGLTRVYHLPEWTLDEYKSWFRENKPTIQYQLATESVKTVDLMPSGTHPSTTPYCWKNGHIQLSSSGLLPNLEYSVVTSRAGQINQNATMIVKNDKRIFDLEILLAGGLVNTTYQALTLQNQVETGLSKVSLSSETEPDYLLYHMIMKLIEEKAYKLDDLTEKVSVFYLYEKLSDEQFETIYSALYPFVEDEYIELPEDEDGEIIEEPIVDESPEEVENEVVM